MEAPRFDDYAGLTLLAGGGFSDVYAAQDVRANGSVALKVARHHDLVLAKRMVEEAALATAVGHESVVRVFGTTTSHDGRVAIAMELLHGSDLQRVLNSGGPLSPAATRRVMDQVCGGVHAMHERGVIHLDLKPANVVAHHAGAERRYVLVDFGIAQRMSARAMRARAQAYGTPSCTAPERLVGGPVDARSDVYGLGVLAFSLLTGRLPFEGETPIRTQRMHLYAPPPRPSAFASVSEEVDVAVLRALAKNPAHRFASARDLGAALNAALASVAAAA